MSIGSDYGSDSDVILKKSKASPTAGMAKNVRVPSGSIQAGTSKLRAPVRGKVSLRCNSLVDFG